MCFKYIKTPSEGGVGGKKQSRPYWDAHWAPLARTAAAAAAGAASGASGVAVVLR